MKYHKYFETNGIKGTLGKFPIIYNFIIKLGIIIGKIFLKKKYQNIIIGQDKKILGNMITNIISQGLNISSLNPIILGIRSTPVVVYLIKISKVHLGLIILASHNPFYYNVFKIFINVIKINNQIEKIIEDNISNIFAISQFLISKKNNFFVFYKFEKRYIKYCIKYLPNSLNRLKIIIDYTNGATFNIVPKIFKKFNNSIILLGINSNRININDKCGVTNLKILKKKSLNITQI